MKIRPEHIEHMRAAIVEAIARVPMARYKRENPDVSPKRMQWDYLRAAGLIPWLCSEIYPYANDTHIDTALRAIFATVKDSPDVTSPGPNTQFEQDARRIAEILKHEGFNAASVAYMRTVDAWMLPRWVAVALNEEIVRLAKETN